MKCNQSCPGIELWSPCPYPVTITITPRAPLERVMFLRCERWVETKTDCYFDPSSSDHSSTSFSSWLGLFNRGSLRIQSPLSAAGSHFNILSSTESNRLCTWLYYCLCPPASAVLPLIYTGVSLDWRLGRGSIYNIQSWNVKKCGVTFYCNYLQVHICPQLMKYQYLKLFNCVQTNDKS